MCSCCLMFYVWCRDSVIGIMTRSWAGLPQESWLDSRRVEETFIMSRLSRQAPGTLVPSYSVSAVNTHRVVTRLLSSCAGNICKSAFRGKQFFEILSLAEWIRWASFRNPSVSEFYLPRQTSWTGLCLIARHSDNYWVYQSRRADMVWHHQTGHTKYVSFTAGGRMIQQDSETSY